MDFCTASEHSEHSSVISEVARRKISARHFLVLTISNHREQYQMGPSERNWQQSPFNCEAEMCADCADYGGTMEMRRWRSIPAETQHFFADLTFLEVNNCCSIEKEVAIFVDKSSLLEECENGNLEKGFYEESQMVAWEGPTESEDDESDNGSYGSGGSSSCWGNYPMREDDEEERRRNTAYVLIGHRSDQPNSVQKFGAEWHNWCAIRDLADSLPPKCAFRQIAFYRKCAGNCRYAFLLLIEVDNVTMQYWSSVSNCVDNAQSLCLNRAFIGLYKEIEFEVDVEVLQHLVSIGKSINCVGRRLIVHFGSEQTFQTNKMHFSSYKNIPSLTSPSASLSIALNMANNNEMAKSDTSEFDAEMEEINEEYRGRGIGDSDRGKRSGKIDENGNQNEAGEMKADLRDQRERKISVWKNLFNSPKTSKQNQRDDQTNNNSGVKLGEWEGNRANRPPLMRQNNFSLKHSIGTFWRKFSTKQ